MSGGEVVEPSGSDQAHADEGVIRCICGQTDDDGFTIQCERCFVWQHAACVRIQKDQVPDVYFCEQCHPRDVDIEFAKELQSQRKRRKTSKSSSKKRKELASVTTTTAKHNVPAGGDVSRKKKQRVSADSRHRFHNSDPAADQSDYHPSHGSGYLATDHDTDQETDFYNQLEDYIPVGKNMISAPVQPMLESLSRRLLSNQGGNQAVDDSHVGAKGEPGVSSAAQAPQLRIVSNEQMIATARMTSIRHLEHSRSSVKTGLVADQLIEAGSLIIECRGQMRLHSDVMKEHSQHRRDGKANYRFIFMAPQSDLLIDANRYGNEARFVRVSCRPNASLHWMKVSGGAGMEMTDESSTYLQLGLFSLTKIASNDEITVQGHEFSIDGSDCACEDYYTCRFRNPPVPETIQRVDEKLNSASPDQNGHIDGNKLATAFQRQDRLSGQRFNQSSASLDSQPIPDSPSTAIDMESELFQKSDRMLSREERKIRDELIRFARMEKDRNLSSSQRRRKSGRDGAKTPKDGVHKQRSPANRSRDASRSRSLTEEHVHTNPTPQQLSNALSKLDTEHSVVNEVDANKPLIEPLVVDVVSSSGRFTPPAEEAVYLRRKVPAKKLWLKMYVETTNDGAILDEQPTASSTPTMADSTFDDSEPIPVSGPLPSIPPSLYRRFQSHLAADPPDVTAPNLVASDASLPCNMAPRDDETVVVVVDEQPPAPAKMDVVSNGGIAAADSSVSHPPAASTMPSEPPTPISVPATPEPVDDSSTAAVPESAPATPVVKQRISLKDYKRRKISTNATTAASDTPLLSATLIPPPPPPVDTAPSTSLSTPADAEPTPQ